MKQITLIVLLLSSLTANAEVTAPPDLAGGVSKSNIETVERIFKHFTEIIGKDVEDYTLEVHKDEELNAYATLGKKVVINSGLIEQTDSEAGLAFVIAHELGHVEEHHVIKGLIRSNFSVFLRYFFFKQNRILNGADYFHQLYYSRDKERDADYYAVDLINKTYCSTPGKLEFFEKISNGQKANKLNEYFSTHPLPQSRLEYLRTEIEAANCVL